jgi:ferredoxin-NADP reductase
LAITHFPLKLVARRMLAPTVAHLSFVARRRAALDFIPGQFVQVHFHYADGTATKRSYSLATIHDHAMARASGGDRGELRGGRRGHGPVRRPATRRRRRRQRPLRRFCLMPADANQRYLLIGTGTGVTPYRAMLPQLERLIVERGIQVVLLFGARTPVELLYGDEFRAFADKHRRTSASCRASRRELPAADSPQAHADVRHGYVQQFLQEFAPHADTDIAYLCGNPNMVDACFETLKALGLPVPQIRREKYVSSKYAAIAVGHVPRRAASCHADAHRREGIAHDVTARPDSCSHWRCRRVLGYRAWQRQRPKARAQGRAYAAEPAPNASWAASPSSRARCRRRGAQASKRMRHVVRCRRTRAAERPQDRAQHRVGSGERIGHHDPDPVFMLAGGPGRRRRKRFRRHQPGVPRRAEAPRRDPGRPARHGKSNPLQCKYDDDETRRRRQRAGRRGSTNRRPPRAPRAMKCRDRAREHADLRFYSTTDAIRDLDAVREAIGAQKINLMGVSYGTRVAQQYANALTRSTRARSCSTRRAECDPSRQRLRAQSRIRARPAVRPVCEDARLHEGARRSARAAQCVDGQAAGRNRRW